MPNLLLFSANWAISLEIALVGAIVLLQIYQFIVTQDHIKHFETCMPSKYWLTRLHIPSDDLQNNAPDELLKNSWKYEEKIPDTISIDVIDSSTTSHKFRVIQKALNTYLLRNQGAAADFNLVKDVVERHITTLENDIHLTLQTPLYLGLGGTMTGIVISLLIFASRVSSGTVDVNLYSEGIHSLLQAVAIGMVASVVGLCLTVWNSIQKYKGAKSVVEDAKNDFYTFIQIELLPVLSRNITSSFQTLHQNLTQFNNGFTTNLSSFQNQLTDFNQGFGGQLTQFNRRFEDNLQILSDVSQTNVEALQQQADLLGKLENIDVRKFLEAHLTIFEAFERNANKLDKFSQYLDKVGQFTTTTNQLNDNFKALLDRTNNFYDLSQRVGTNLERNNRLLQFLDSNSDAMKAYAEKINHSITKLDNAFENNLASLQESLQNNRSKTESHIKQSVAKLEGAFQDNADGLAEGLKLNRVQMQTYLNEEVKALQDMMRRNNGGFAYLEYLQSLNEQLQKLHQEGGQNHQSFIKVLGIIEKQLTHLNTQSSQNHKQFAKTLELQWNDAQQVAYADAEKWHQQLETQFKNLGQLLETQSKNLGRQLETQSKNLGQQLQTQSKNLGQQLQTQSEHLGQQIESAIVQRTNQTTHQVSDKGGLFKWFTKLFTKRKELK